MMEGDMKRSFSVLSIFFTIICFFCAAAAAPAAERSAKNPAGKEKQGKTTIEYVSFPDTLKKYDAFPWETAKINEFAGAYGKTVGAGNMEDWARTLTGTGNRNRLLHTLKTNYVLISCCKPHDCDTSQIVVLFNPSSRGCWAIYAHDGVFDYLGSPDENIKNLLRILLVDEYKDIYAGQ